MAKDRDRSIEEILVNLIDSIEAAKETNPDFKTSFNIDLWMNRGKEKIHPDRYEMYNHRLSNGAKRVKER